MFQSLATVAFVLLYSVGQHLLLGKQSQPVENKYVIAKAVEKSFKLIDEFCGELISVLDFEPVEARKVLIKKEEAGILWQELTQNLLKISQSPVPESAS